MKLIRYTTSRRTFESTLLILDGMFIASDKEAESLESLEGTDLWPIDDGNDNCISVVFHMDDVEIVTQDKASINLFRQWTQGKSGEVGIRWRHHFFTLPYEYWYHRGYGEYVLSDDNTLDEKILEEKLIYGYADAYRKGWYDGILHLVENTEVDIEENNEQ